MKYRSLEDLPLTLTAADIAEITGLSLAKAYELIHSNGFPKVVVGRRLIVPKLAFVKWMECPTRAAI